MDESKLLLGQEMELSLKELFRHCCEPQVALIRAFATEFGHQRTLELVKGARREAVLQAALKLQENLAWRSSHSSDFDLFTEALERVLGSDFHRQALTIQPIERTSTKLCLKVTRCLWAEVYRELQAEELGYAYICEPNRVLPEAFSPKIRLERAKTLMLGDEYCDHCYVLEETG